MITHRVHSLKFPDASKCKLCLSIVPALTAMLCLLRMLNRLVKVVWDDIWSWMVFGHLRSNSKGDFFITENSSQALFLVDDLPSFVTMRTGEKIFFSGQLVRYYNSSFSGRDIAGIFEKSIDEKFESIVEISTLPFKVRSFNLLIESIRREAALVCTKLKFILVEPSLTEFCPINGQFFRIVGNIDNPVFEGAVL